MDIAFTPGSGDLKMRRCVEDLNPDPAFPGCVYSEMKMCLAPCFRGCTDDEYRAEVVRVFAGGVAVEFARIVPESDFSEDYRL